MIVASVPGEHPRDKQKAAPATAMPGRTIVRPVGCRFVTSALVSGVRRRWSLGWVWVLLVVSLDRVGMW